MCSTALLAAFVIKFSPGTVLGVIQFYLGLIHATHAEHAQTKKEAVILSWVSYQLILNNLKIVSGPDSHSIHLPLQPVKPQKSKEDLAWGTWSSDSANKETETAVTQGVPQLILHLLGPWSETLGTSQNHGSSGTCDHTADQNSISVGGTQEWVFLKKISDRYDSIIEPRCVRYTQILSSKSLHLCDWENDSQFHKLRSPQTGGWDELCLVLEERRKADKSLPPHLPLDRCRDLIQQRPVCIFGQDTVNVPTSLHTCS